MVDVAADGAGSRLHRDDVQIEAAEDPEVGVEDLPVRLLHGLLVDVEGVRVGHEQLAGAQQPEAGPGLVPELDLDLVDGEGQLPVRVDLGADGHRRHLLVGGPEDEGPTPDVDGHGRQGVVAEQGGPARLLPQLDGMEDREQHLLAAGGIELLSDHLLDPLQHPQSERQEGVDPRCQPPDVPGPDEELVAGHLGVGRCLSQGADQELGHAHGRRSYRPRPSFPVVTPVAGRPRRPAGPPSRNDG